MPQKGISSHFHYRFNKELPGSQVPLTVELHWDLVRKNTAELDINDFWNQAIPIEQSQYVKELSDDHTFYMICFHGWRHNLQSLKYFLDIIQMIHILGGKLNYHALFKDAAAHKTLKRIVRTLSIVYRRSLIRFKNFPASGHVCIGNTMPAAIQVKEG